MAKVAGRVVMLPQSLAHRRSRRGCTLARAVWDADAKAGRGGVQTPHALKGNTRGGQHLGPGSVFPSPDAVGRPRFQVWSGGTICSRSACSAPSGFPARPASPSRCPCTLPPFLRHAPVAGGHRHSHGAGAAGAIGCVSTTMIYACAQSGSRRHDNTLDALALPSEAAAGASDAIATSLSTRPR